MRTVILLGNLTDNPQLKSVGTHNTALCTFQIAVSEYVKGGSKVHYFACKAWSKTAENIAKYFTKGKPILIDGFLEQERWEDNGQKRSRVIVKVNNFEFIGGDKTTQSSNEPTNEEAW